MVRWMVDNDPVVGTFVVLARVVPNCRPVKGIPLSGRPHSFQDLIVDDGVLRQPFHDLGRVQRRLPFHLHRRIPEIVAQFATGDTLQKYNESWTKSLSMKQSRMEFKWGVRWSKQGVQRGSVLRIITLIVMQADNTASRYSAVIAGILYMYRLESSKYVACPAGFNGLMGRWRSVKS